MKKNTLISVTSCVITSTFCWFVAPAKRRKNILKCLPLSVIFATIWGLLLDFKADTEDTNKLVNDVIKNNIKTAPHIKLDDLDDAEDEDFIEI